MTGYENKSAAALALANLLSDRGWTVHGYSAGEADGMTDYFCKGSWRGYAEHPQRPGFRVVSCFATSGYQVTRTEIDRAECPRCGGTGADPHLRAWTLDKARQDPQAFHYAREAAATAAFGSPQGRAMLRDVVSPICFADGGAAKCQRCTGSGDIVAGSRRVVEAIWPTFCDVPSSQAFAWLERDGRIVASFGRAKTIAKHVSRYGSGSMSGRGEGFADAMREIEKILATIDAHTTTPTPAPTHYFDPDPAAPASFQIRPGKRPGYVEITFADKPAEAIRDRLKGLGFRWSRSGGCWYGRESALSPDTIAEMATAD